MGPDFLIFGFSQWKHWKSFRDHLIWCCLMVPPAYFKCLAGVWNSLSLLQPDLQSIKQTPFNQFAITAFFYLFVLHIPGRDWHWNVAHNRWCRGICFNLVTSLQSYWGCSLFWLTPPIHTELTQTKWETIWAFDMPSIHMNVWASNPIAWISPCLNPSMK